MSTTEGWNADFQNDRSKAIRLAVPGMPIGSPGVEQESRRDQISRHSIFINLPFGLCFIHVATGPTAWMWTLLNTLL